MVRVVCECGEEMIMHDEDDRQYTHKEFYDCTECNRKKVHIIERDQNGLVQDDRIEDD